MIKEKRFRPSFTIKSTGQAMDLGLSLCYDIITKGHGGVAITIGMKVETKEGEGTCFIISIPVNK